ncbi:MAG: aminotransferase class I/II-fold pyridoxal phosphate-dependent enzyme, partial [Betaproteobacteria bacterium]|nr:aminotransferase class I/II-fold pyridoxal phosphate-dependent enzyme [Betaproteobacteria bacterium]
CLTQAAARFALQHLDALLAQTEHLKQERTRVAAALDKMVGITRFPSEANFILIRVPNASAVFQTLLSKKILVKNTSTAHPLLSNTLRLTIGTPDENNALLNALQP